ncbi:hypothetical protein MRX96_017234 [Rhipicephalus microplus]
MPATRMTGASTSLGAGVGSVRLKNVVRHVGSGGRGGRRVTCRRRVYASRSKFVSLPDVGFGPMGKPFRVGFPGRDAHSRTPVGTWCGRLCVWPCARAVEDLGQWSDGGLRAQRRAARTTDDAERSASTSAANVWLMRRRTRRTGGGFARRQVKSSATEVLVFSDYDVGRST